MGIVKKATLIVGVCLSLGLFSSCATLDENQCRAVDWNTLGTKDGEQGRSADYIGQHRKACERHKLPVDEQSWRSGWERGIRAYCTPENGLFVGRGGQSYTNSCPTELKAGFEEAYRVARTLRDAESRLSRVRDQVEQLMKAEASAKTREEAAKIRQQIAERRADLFRAESDVRDAEREYDRHVRMIKS